MGQRTGVQSLRAVAREMCRLLTKFEPVIIALYPDNTALQAALAAAKAACAALIIELDKVVQYGD